MIDGIPNRPLYFYQKDIIVSHQADYQQKHEISSQKFQWIYQFYGRYGRLTPGKSYCVQCFNLSRGQIIQAEILMILT